MYLPSLVKSMALATTVFGVGFPPTGEVADVIEGAAVLGGNGTFSGTCSGETGIWPDWRWDMTRDPADLSGLASFDTPNHQSDMNITSDPSSQKQKEPPQSLRECLWALENLRRHRVRLKIRPTSYGWSLAKGAFLFWVKANVGLVGWLQANGKWGSPQGLTEFNESLPHIKIIEGSARLF